ncbi:hypothetical protein RvY_18086 [Ramazzottius varieornatus]|uniref:Uncharacterized protein n=1 Tax=Ramazzottius varieornatus TaxID=947166 RepID=A0A1D1W4H5_RAMVA|nr:hypothetical protein RvY_18086 [Ramazzottius varieornatus]
MSSPFCPISPKRYSHFPQASVSHHLIFIFHTKYLDKFPDLQDREKPLVGWISTIFHKKTVTMAKTRSQKNYLKLQENNHSAGGPHGRKRFQLSHSRRKTNPILPIGIGIVGRTVMLTQSNFPPVLVQPCEDDQPNGTPNL